MLVGKGMGRREHPTRILVQIHAGPLCRVLSSLAELSVATMIKLSVSTWKARQHADQNERP